MIPTFFISFFLGQVGGQPYWEQEENIEAAIAVSQDEKVELVHKMAPLGATAPRARIRSLKTLSDKLGRDISFGTPLQQPQ